MRLKGITFFTGLAMLAIPVSSHGQASAHWLCAGGFGRAGNRLDSNGVINRTDAAIGTALLGTVNAWSAYFEGGREWPLDEKDDQWLAVLVGAGLSDWDFMASELIPAEKVFRLFRARLSMLSGSLLYDTVIPTRWKKSRIGIQIGMAGGITTSKILNQDKEASEVYHIATVSANPPVGWWGLEARILMDPGKGLPALGFRMAPWWMPTRDRFGIRIEEGSPWKASSVEMGAFEFMVFTSWRIR